MYSSVFDRTSEDAGTPNGLTVEHTPYIEQLRQDTEFCALARFLRKYYIVLVAHEGVGGDRLVLNCTYSMPLIEREYHAAKWDLVRRFMGTGAYRFRFPLSLANRTKSYHFTMTGPQQHFVREQSVRKFVPSRADAGGTSTAGELVPIEPRAPLEEQVGRPSSVGRQVHLYLGHWFSREDRPRIYARVVFYELAPGQQGVAAAIAALQAAMLCGILVVFQHLVTASDSIDLPALLLAVPGVLSTVSYPRASETGVNQIPIRARLTLIMTTIIALLSALSYVWLWAWSEGPSFVTYMGWTAGVVVDLALVVWCLRGVLFNRSAYFEAARYRGEIDFFTTGDHKTLVKWDKKKNERRKDDG